MYKRFTTRSQVSNREEVFQKFGIVRRTMWKGIRQGFQSYTVFIIFKSCPSQKHSYGGYQSKKPQNSNKITSNKLKQLQPV